MLNRGHWAVSLTHLSAHACLIKCFLPPIPSRGTLGMFVAPQLGVKAAQAIQLASASKQKVGALIALVSGNAGFCHQPPFEDAGGSARGDLTIDSRGRLAH